MAASLLGRGWGPVGTRLSRGAGSSGISPDAAHPPPRARPPPALPLAMLPPLPHARLAGVVVAGLGSYVRRHAAQLR